MYAEPAPASAAVASAQSQTSEQDLIQLEKRWWEAFKNRDKAALEAILADEYFGLDYGADKPTGKREWIDHAVNGESRVAAARPDFSLTLGMTGSPFDFCLMGLASPGSAKS